MHGADGGHSQRVEPQRQIAKPDARPETRHLGLLERVRHRRVAPVVGPGRFLPLFLVFHGHVHLNLALDDDEVRVVAAVALGEHVLALVDFNLGHLLGEFHDPRVAETGEPRGSLHRGDHGLESFAERAPPPAPALLPLAPEPIVPRGYVFSEERKHHLPRALAVPRAQSLAVQHVIAPSQEQVQPRRAVHDEHGPAKHLFAVDEIAYIRGPSALRRGGPELVLDVESNAPVDEEPDDVGVATLRGEDERRGVVPHILRVQVGAEAVEVADYVQVPVSRREVSRGGSPPHAADD